MNRSSKVYCTDTDDPWMNLCIEDMLFRRLKPGGRCLLMWSSRSSVVIGRYQNPWLECRLDLMKAEGVGLVRRQSGGGAVYHDPGNLNFSFISEKHEHSPERNLGIITAALEAAGIRAEVNKRNDITADGRKFSGSAFRIARGKAYHHGTLLVDSNLGRLGTYLAPEEQKIESKGIRSVRSAVVNLSEMKPGFTAADAAEYISRAFSEYYGNAGSGAEKPLILGRSDINKDHAAAEYLEKLKSRDWLYGGCPDFTVETAAVSGPETARLRLNVKKAVIESAEPAAAGPGGSGNAAERLAALLPGLFYEKNVLEAAVMSAGPDYRFPNVPELPEA